MAVTVTFDGAKGSLTLTEDEVEAMIRWYERELRRMDQQEKRAIRYTEWHRRDYGRTVDDYRRRLEEARRNKG